MEQPKPNIVILTIGRTGSTVLCKMLRALGWKVPGADRKYEENLRFRRLNTLIRQGTSPTSDDREAFVTSLSKHEPWVLKDPRLICTWEFWEPVLPPDTLLLWLTRDLAEVEASLRKQEWGEMAPRGYTIRGFTLPDAQTRCETICRTWDGPTLHVDYEQLHAMVSLFDLQLAPPKNATSSQTVPV